MYRTTKNLLAATVAASLVVTLSGCVAATSTSPATSIPDGVYRNDISVEELLDAGWSLDDARANGGIQTLTIDEGSYTVNVKDSPPDCTGTISVSGETAHFEETPGICSGPDEGLIWELDWQLEGDQLTFSNLNLIEGATDLSLAEGFEQRWTGRPWTVIQ